MADIFMERVPRTIHTIKGKCLGIAISQYDNPKNYLRLTLLCEDDDNWFICERGFNCFWMPDLQQVLTRTEQWLNTHAIKSTWGWSLPKEGKSK